MPGPVRTQLPPGTIDVLGVPSTVSVSPNVRASASTGALATIADVVTFPGVAPPFTIIGMWAVPNARTLAAGLPTISAGATGVCFNIVGVPTSPMQAVVTDPRVTAQ